MEFDADKIAMETGISASRVKDDLVIYSVMSELFPKFEINKQKIGLYGGTALNKIYFEKYQRLSYDIDLFSYDYKKTFDFISKLGAVLISKSSEKERCKFRFNGVDIDVWGLKSGGIIEKPVKKELFDLFYYLGYLIPPLVVPSYSLEYLMAEKTFALADRNMLKDIYDTWRGFKIMKDKKKYKEYIEKLGRLNSIDLFSYTVSRISFMLKNIKYYRKERIDLLYQPDPEIMLNEIKLAIKNLQ